MFSTLMVTFREGVEAFLIAAFTLAFLQQTGRQHLVPAVWWGIAVAVLSSALVGVALAVAGGMSPAAEGWLALAAAALVISCTQHILRHGKRLAGEIRARMARASETKGRGAWWAVFGFVVLMIGREGVETATMIASLARAGDMQHLLAGATIGVLCAATLAFAWARFGRRVDLSLFFRVTAVFMVLFSIQLVIYALHEFSEAGVLPLVDNEWWHLATEPYGPEGVYGAWLSYSLVLLPLGFLIAGLMRKPRSFGPPANPAS